MESFTGMFIKTLIASLVLPGIVAFLIPALWLWHTGNTQFVQPFGLIFIAVGIGGLLWCIADFYIKGKGTLAPWSPPEKLVVNGLYRYSRNPMYISVGLILLGWAISFNAFGLYIYFLLVLTAFHLFIIYYEEPYLKRKYGRKWELYADHVPRWLW